MSLECRATFWPFWQTDTYLSIWASPDFSAKSVLGLPLTPFAARPFAYSWTRLFGVLKDISLLSMVFFTRCGGGKMKESSEIDKTKGRARAWPDTPSWHHADQYRRKRHARIIPLWNTETGRCRSDLTRWTETGFRNSNPWLYVPKFNRWRMVGS